MTALTITIPAELIRLLDVPAQLDWTPEVAAAEVERILDMKLGAPSPAGD